MRSTEVYVPVLPPFYYESLSKSHERFSMNPYFEFTNRNRTSSSGWLDDILGKHQLLTLQAAGNINGDDDSSFVMQVLDCQGQILMYSSLTNVLRRDDIFKRTEKLVTFTDATDNFLFAWKETEHNIVVSGENDRLVGMFNRIHGLGILLLPDLTARNAAGEDIFRTRKGSGNSFRFFCKDTQIATAKETFSKANGYELSIAFSSSMDVRTKVLLIAASDYLNLLFFVETTFGVKGTLTVTRTTYAIAIFTVVFLAFVIHELMTSFTLYRMVVNMVY